MHPSFAFQIIMESYYVVQRVQIIKRYYQNECSVRATFRALRNFYDAKNRPVEAIICHLVDKFQSTGPVTNQSIPVRR